MKKKIVYKSLIAFIIVMLIIAFFFFKNKSSKQNINDITVKQITLTKSDIYTIDNHNFVQQIAITGIFKPINEAQIKSKISGEITDLTLKVGDKVIKGQLIAKITNQDIQSRIQQTNAQVNLFHQQIKVAQSQYNRYAELAKQNFISQNALETYKNSLDLANANLKVAISNHNINLKSQEDSYIYSPFTGIVANKLVQNKEKVSADLPIMHLVDITSLELEAGVSSEYIPLIKVHQQVNLSIDNQEKISGTVMRIAPSSINNSRLINIYINIKNKDNLIKAGTFTKGNIILQNLNLNAVPSSSIVKQVNKNPFVYVIKQDKLVKTDIQEGIEQDNFTAINLPKGEQIIITPLPANIDLNFPIKIQ